MYCPRCSQQQLTYDVRFCSKCGFQLKIVAQLLLTNGALTSYEKPPKLSILKRGKTRIGAKLIFFGAILFPVGFLLAVIFDAPVLLMPPLLTFLIGLAQILYQLIFGKKILTSSPEPQSAMFLNEPPTDFYFSAAQNIPLTTDNLKSSDTAQIVKPPSVTEHTTKLLDHQ